MRARRRIVSRDTVVLPHAPQCHAGIRWPHHSCREMHQSRILCIHSKYVFAQFGRNERDAAVFHGLNGRLGQRFHFHPPLHRNQRLHDSLAALACPRLSLYGSIFLEQPQLFQLRDHLLPRLEPVERRKFARLRRHLRVFVDHFDVGRLWRLPASKSFGSCAGVIFTAPEPNSGSAIVIENNRNLAIHQRQAAPFCRASSAARGSLGLMATAVSPSMVSGRVVATTSFIELPFTG